MLPLQRRQRAAQQRSVGRRRVDGGNHLRRRAGAHARSAQALQPGTFVCTLHPIAALKQQALR